MKKVIYGLNKNGQEMQNFREYNPQNLYEEIKPYKLVWFVNSHDESRDVSDNSSTATLWKLMQSSAKKAGVEIYRVDFQGTFVERKGGKTFIHAYGFNEDDAVTLPNEKGDLAVPKQKPIEVHPDNTVLFSRGLGTQGMTNIQTWTDIIHEFELEGYVTIPSLATWYKCSSKYLTDILCRQEGLRTPKTVPIAYSDDTERVMKELDNKFPIILKASIGSQTGVGVLIQESMRSLYSTVQMLKLYDKNLAILLQEYVKTDYDVRVIVLDGEILGTMKREVITDGDFRSNVSLGAESTSFKLTKIEERDSLAAAEAVDGRLVGVDFIPAKNREKDQPYILEVNSMPGFGGIEKIEKGLTQKILEYFKDRRTWKTRPAGPLNSD